MSSADARPNASDDLTGELLLEPVTKEGKGAGEITQQVRGLAGKPGDLSSVPPR